MNKKEGHDALLPFSAHKREYDDSKKRERGREREDAAIRKGGQTITLYQGGCFPESGFQKNRKLPNGEEVSGAISIFFPLKKLNTGIKYGTANG